LESFLKVHVPEAGSQDRASLANAQSNAASGAFRAVRWTARAYDRHKRLSFRALDHVLACDCAKRTISTVALVASISLWSGWPSDALLPCRASYALLARVPFVAFRACRPYGACHTLLSGRARCALAARLALVALIALVTFRTRRSCHTLDSRHARIALIALRSLRALKLIAARNPEGSGQRGYGDEVAHRVSGSG
jgi:hypothetical protein